ncbi:hypothetical protein JCM6882_002230 [Rhodosporidiobolus microsporus]
MAWTGRTSSAGAPYTALPASPSRSPSPSYPPSHAPSPRRTQRAVFLIGLLVVVLLGSVSLVPQEHLPSHVQSAVSKGKEAFEAAKAGVASASAGWRWDQAGVDEEDEGVPAMTEDPWVEAQAPSADEEEKVRLDEEEERPAIVIPLPGQDDDGAEPKEWAPAQEEVEEEVAIVCSSELKEAMGKPAFWAVSETSPRTYRIAARDALDVDVSEVCLSQAIFTARLVSSPPASPSAEDANAEQTVVSLPRPELGDDLASYELVLPSDLAVPKGEYELDVRLDFGLYVGVLEGTICGEGAKTCDPLVLSEKEGEELRYGGDKVEVVSGKTVELGRDDLTSAAVLPLCTDLSSLDGHWSSLSYRPTSPAPCSLAVPSFPMQFVPSTSTYTPLWIHLVGDSNTRNMFTHLVNALGNGGKINAPKVRDSPTHNGTVASVAFRWKDGEMPAKGNEAAAMPDVIVSWQWWYEMAPPSSASNPPSPATTEEERAAEFDATVAANRDDLVQFVDATLAQYLVRANMKNALSSFPALRDAAKTLRPHRIYLSFGSHGEELALSGVAASLDELFSSSSGLSSATRDAANLRLFTTTLVNARYIPLARFPHQDLVRTNAFISAKNAYAASRPELGGEGRVINVEKLTRGIVEEDGWMKQTKYGPDAVHFRDEVYDEWVRVLWTDLMQGVGVDEELEEVGVEEARKRWKRRIASFEEEEDED